MKYVKELGVNSRFCLKGISILRVRLLNLAKEV